MSSKQMGDQVYSKKGWLIFRKEGTKAFLKRLAFRHEGSGLRPPTKGVNYHFTAIGQAVRRWKALNLGSLSMQFQQDWPKDKKLQLFNFFKRKLRKFSR